MSLFEHDESKPSKLKVNKEFAKKFEHRKKREHLEKAQKELTQKQKKSFFALKNLYS